MFKKHLLLVAPVSIPELPTALRAGLDLGGSLCSLPPKPQGTKSVALPGQWDSPKISWQNLQTSTGTTLRLTFVLIMLWLKHLKVKCKVLSMASKALLGLFYLSLHLLVLVLSTYVTASHHNFLQDYSSSSPLYNISPPPPTYNTDTHSYHLASTYLSSTPQHCWHCL